MIESVTVNKESLSLTFIFIGIVIYAFTIIGQFFFREDYSYKLSAPNADNETHVDTCSTTSRNACAHARRARAGRAHVRGART